MKWSVKSPFCFANIRIMYQKETARNPHCLRLYLHLLIKARAHHCLDLDDDARTLVQSSQHSKWKSVIWHPARSPRMSPSEQHLLPLSVCNQGWPKKRKKKNPYKTGQKLRLIYLFFGGWHNAFSVGSLCPECRVEHRDAWVTALCNLGTLQPSQVTTAVNLLTRQIHM